jgi:hypothetical protein
MEKVKCAYACTFYKSHAKFPNITTQDIIGLL